MTDQKNFLRQPFWPLEIRPPFRMYALVSALVAASPRQILSHLYLKMGSLPSSKIDIIALKGVGRGRRRMRGEGGRQNREDDSI